MILYESENRENSQNDEPRDNNGFSEKIRVENKGTVYLWTTL